jgi:threonine synthase
VRYISTRHGSQGDPAPLGFEDIMLAGLARDGGLYLPAEWPHFSTAEIARLKDLSYGELAFRIMQPFVGDAFDEATFRRLIGEAYASFETPEVAPLKALGDVTREEGGLHLLELFHGPTLAFKDVALQLLGRMLDHTLRARGQRATIVGATSGDTGSAAIEAVRDRKTIDIFMLHPRGRISEVQRRQMTTVLAPNVHNIAIAGTFDDCQDLAKACFNDLAFRDRADNLARIARIKRVDPFCGRDFLSINHQRIFCSKSRPDFTQSRPHLFLALFVHPVNQRRVFEGILRRGFTCCTVARIGIRRGMSIDLGCHFGREFDRRNICFRAGAF